MKYSLARCKFRRGNSQIGTRQMPSAIISGTKTSGIGNSLDGENVSARSYAGHGLRKLKNPAPPAVALMPQLRKILRRMSALLTRCSAGRKDQRNPPIILVSVLSCRHYAGDPGQLGLAEAESGGDQQGLQLRRIRSFVAEVPPMGIAGAYRYDSHRRGIGGDACAHKHRGGPTGTLGQNDS